MMRECICRQVLVPSIWLDTDFTDTDSVSNYLYIFKPLTLPVNIIGLAQSLFNTVGALLHNWP